MGLRDADLRHKKTGGWDAETGGQIARSLARRRRFYLYMFRT